MKCYTETEVLEMIIKSAACGFLGAALIVVLAMISFQFKLRRKLIEKEKEL